jgi:hypothetical protein
MPTPVSEMVIDTADADEVSATRISPPGGVNFTALVRRFQTTCWRRPGSPTTSPWMRSIVRSTRRFFASAAGRMESIAPSMMRAGSIGWRSRRILPEMMRLTSRRSEMSWPCWRAFRSMISRPFCISAGLLPAARRRRPDQPRMALSGVLSSWLSVATNSSLARPARSASSRAARSASCRSWRSISRWYCWVMSRTSITLATRRPFWRIWRTAYWTRTGRPCLVWNVSERGSVSVESMNAPSTLQPVGGTDRRIGVGFVENVVERGTCKVGESIPKEVFARRIDEGAAAELVGHEERRGGVVGDGAERFALREEFLAEARGHPHAAELVREPLEEPHVLLRPFAGAEAVNLERAGPRIIGAERGRQERSRCVPAREAGRLEIRTERRIGDEGRTVALDDDLGERV